jgi:hypothetical protein
MEPAEISTRLTTCRILVCACEMAAAATCRASKRPRPESVNCPQHSSRAPVQLPIFVTYQLQNPSPAAGCKRVLITPLAPSIRLERMLPCALPLRVAYLRAVLSR